MSGTVQPNDKTAAEREDPTSALEIFYMVSGTTTF